MGLLPARARAAREQWQWRGQARPSFAVAPAPGRESVWDYPRPPRLAPDTREAVVRRGRRLVVARTRRAARVLEIAHPPSFYLPSEDLVPHLLQPASDNW